MKFALRDPNAAYLDNWLWLPKRYWSASQLRGSLQYFDPRKNEAFEVIAETPHHYKVPRNFLNWGTFSSLPYPVYDLRFLDFPKVELKSKVVLDAKEPHKTYQRDGSRALLNTYDGILSLRCGAGKALHNDEPVLTTRGWVRIADVTTEDKVIGSDGNPYPVLGVYPQGRRPLYLVVFSDKTTIVADGDHLWSVRSKRNKRGKDCRYPILTTEQMLHNGVVLEDGGYRYSVPVARPDPGKHDPNLPVDPYTLGFFWSRAYFGHGAVAIRETQEVFDKLIIPPGVDYRVSASRDKHAKGCVEHRSYVSLGGKNVLGLAELPPEQYMRASVEQRVALLQGYLDPRGIPRATKRAIEVPVGNDTQLSLVRELVGGLGGFVRIKERTGRYSAYRVYVHLPAGIVPFRDPMKLAKYKSRVRLERTIQEIIPCGEGPATCISVGAPDKLFRTRNHILTHNTVTALHTAAQIKQPILVVVGDKGLARQWMEEIEQWLGIPEREIGRIGGDGSPFNWEHKITVGIINSIALRAIDDRLPPEMLKHFGAVIADEAHIAGAPLFNAALPPFHGRRWGLTATPNREDGYDSLLRYTMGNVVYSYLLPDLVPTVYFRRLPTSLDMTKPEVVERTTDTTGALHLGKIYDYFSDLDQRTTQIAKDVQKAVDDGRQVLVLTHSRAMCDKLAEKLPTAGVCHGGVKEKDRLRRIKESNPVVAIVQLGKQALNKPSLDTLFVCEPFKKEGILQQAMGRVLRAHPGKQAPIVVFYEDSNVEILYRICNKIRSSLSRWSDNKGGRIKYFNK